VSERLRKVYLKREEKRIEDIVKGINKTHLDRMHAAGKVFLKRQKEREEWCVNCPKRKDRVVS